MASKRSLDAYPKNHRANDIAIIMDWIKAGESGSVIGLPGVGKSNLLRYICHGPEAIQPYLPHSAYKLALVLVDLNNLPDNSLATFYRVILRAMVEVQDQLASIEPALAETIETLYHNIEEKTDPFISQSALRKMLLLFQAKAVRLVLVFDPFDRFCQTAPLQLLDNLRGLRDSFKTTLTYLIGIRHELAYLRDPQEMGELHEILDTHLHRLGPMESQDSNWLIEQMQEALRYQFSPDEVERLIEVTGAYPLLLRTATIWLARSPAPRPESWIEALLAQPGIQNRLQELWNALTGAEQLTLAELHQTGQKTKQFWQKHSDLLKQLQLKRVCRPTDNGEWEVFSPLFGAFIRQVGVNYGGRIWQRTNDDTLWRGNESLERQLTPQTRKLLQFLLAHPLKILSKDRIISALWSEDEVFEDGVDDMRLQKAISQLRGTLETQGETPRYIQTVRGIGYRFFPEGAPQTLSVYEGEV